MPATFKGDWGAKLMVTQGVMENPKPAAIFGLHTTALVPNVALRNAIAEWRAIQPMAIDPERLSLTEELIGEGSFGHVFAGVLTTHGREQRVAVKTLPALTQKEVRLQFERELKAHMTAQQVRMHAYGRLCGTVPLRILFGMNARKGRSRRAFSGLVSVCDRAHAMYARAAGCGRSVSPAWNLREAQPAVPSDEALRA
jgi:hypothetical protein